MKCVDQEHAVITPPLSGYHRNSQIGEQPYSLRERVAHLENLVEGLTKRLDQQDSSTSPCERHEINTCWYRSDACGLMLHD